MRIPEKPPSKNEISKLLRRSKDGTWVKKGGKFYFGYKLHSKSDMDYGLIRNGSVPILL